jgi:DNA transformation protein and related proteins
MACSQSFVDHALDLLSGLGPVEARRMFGGYGVYARGVMLGLLWGDELFLRVDAETEGRFLEAGCRRWAYPGNADMRMSYFRPPDEAHENPEAMHPWARLGLEAALRRKASKDRQAASKAARRAERERKPKARATARPAARPRGKARRAKGRPRSAR